MSLVNRINFLQKTQDFTDQSLFFYVNLSHLSFVLFFAFITFSPYGHPFILPVTTFHSLFHQELHDYTIGKAF